MAQLDQITASLLRAVDELNTELPPDKRVPPDPDSLLYGSQGRLDSLGLVNLVLAAERNIQQDFGCAITLADERALSETKSPFQTINSLALYVAKLLNGAEVKSEPA